MLNYVSGGSAFVFVYAVILALITILLEAMFYSKRGVFLYSLLGLIAGFYSGKLMYELFSQMLPSLFTEQIKPIAEQIKPYFILTFSYLGFILPTMASQKYGSSALNLAFGGEGERKSDDIKLLDTSVVIDGRIADIAETGFICGTLILPKFVLNEIQALADSKDPIKRSRARRGLDVLNKLKEIQTLDLKIFSRDYPEIKGVDAKLIALAKEMTASIITNDYNLNKVAKLDSIQILNLNDLANAMKPVLLPGEEMELDVLKEGKENNQGVGYLSDGTMVVVANGINYIVKRINVKVTSILQTSAGRIIFTEPKR
jgi:uncharacterized protein YacL